jgi:hypothetical protein
VDFSISYFVTFSWGRNPYVELDFEKRHMFLHYTYDSIDGVQV